VRGIFRDRYARQEDAICTERETIVEQSRRQSVFKQHRPECKYIRPAYNEDDALFQKAAIKATDKIILIVDHSKSEKTAVFSAAALSQFDYVVSNKLLSPL
jgi:hypothetical protein